MHTAWLGWGNPGLVLVFHEAATTPWLDRILRLEPAQSRRPRQDRADAALLDESLTPHATAPDAATTNYLPPTTLRGLFWPVSSRVSARTSSATSTLRLEAEALLEPAATTAAHALPEVLATVAVMRATA